MWNELLSFLRQGSNSVMYTKHTKLRYNSSLKPHLLIHKSQRVTYTVFLQFTLPNSTRWLYGYVLFTCNKHGSFSECTFFPTKISIKTSDDFSVSRLGLTSLVFIRNTSLSLCWYKSTQVPTGARLIYTRAGSNFMYSFLSLLSCWQEPNSKAFCAFVSLCVRSAKVLCKTDGQT